MPGQTALADMLGISERFQDLPFDLDDASVAEAAARLKIRQTLTLDSDFDLCLDKAGKPLVELSRYSWCRCFRCGWRVKQAVMR